MTTRIVGSAIMSRLVGEGRGGGAMSRVTGQPGHSVPAALVAPPRRTARTRLAVRQAASSGSGCDSSPPWSACSTWRCWPSAGSPPHPGHEGIMRTHEEARTEDGIIVGEVAPGSPADGADLRPGRRDPRHRRDTGDGRRRDPRPLPPPAGRRSQHRGGRRASAPAAPPQSVDPATALIYGVSRASAPTDSRAGDALVRPPLPTRNIDHRRRHADPEHRPGC